MSRLDPFRERRHFLDAIEAERELREDQVLHEPRPLDEEVITPREPSGRASIEPPASLPEVRSPDSRCILYDRDRGYRLGDSETRTLVDIGKFRVVAPDDLKIHVYAGDRERMREDLGSLLRQGLIRRGTFEGPDQNSRELLTLTKRGFRLLCVNRVVPKDQAIYYGFVKPREANHDADLYNLYQKELARIVKEGGRNPRVRLDFELKRKINRDILKLGPEARPEIARRHGLRVVRGRIPVPDLRIEYETPSGDIARLDLELVTEHYRARSVADKVRAGFALYTLHGEGDRLRRVLDQNELTAEILSL
jgi:hypothetical protein